MVSVFLPVLPWLLVTSCLLQSPERLLVVNFFVNVRVVMLLAVYRIRKRIAAVYSRICIETAQGFLHLTGALEQLLELFQGALIVPADQTRFTNCMPEMRVAIKQRCAGPSHLRALNPLVIQLRRRD